MGGWTGIGKDTIDWDGTIKANSMSMTKGIIAGMSITNDGVKTTLLGKSGDYLRIGDATTTGHSLNSEDDLLVTRNLEVEGVTYFNNDVQIWGTNVIGFYEAGFAEAFIMPNYEFDDMRIVVGAQVGRQILYVDSENSFNKDFDHDTQTNPTLFIHSATNPDDDNTQWASLTHDQTDLVLATGSGDIKIVGANLKMDGGMVVNIASPVAALEGLKINYELAGTNWNLFEVQSNGDLNVTSNKASYNVDWNDANHSTTGKITHTGWTWIGATVADWSDNIKSISIKNNQSSAFSIVSGITPDEYLNITTTTGSEAITFGTSSTNPDYNFTGSGTTDIDGDLNVDGTTTLDETTIQGDDAGASDLTFCSILGGDKGLSFGALKGDKVVIKGGKGSNHPSTGTKGAGGDVNIYGGDAGDTGLGTAGEGIINLYSDTIFIGAGSGLPFGSFYGNEFNQSQAMTTDTEYQVAHASIATGQSNNITTDGNGMFTITKAGKYKVDWSITASHSAVAKHILWGIALDQLLQADGQQHRETIAADKEYNISGNGIIDVAVGEDIEIGFKSDDGTPGTALISHMNLTVTQIGG